MGVFPYMVEHHQIYRNYTSQITNYNIRYVEFVLRAFESGLMMMMMMMMMFVLDSGSLSLVFWELQDL